MALTYAGEYVLEFANTVISEETNLKDILKDIQHHERGVLRFGGSTLRLNACLPQVLPKFTLEYPDVEIRVTDTISTKLEPLITSGELDLAIVLSNGEWQPTIISNHLMSDQIYLCVADSLLLRYYPHRAEEIKRSGVNGISVKDVSELPFCLFSNRLGRELKKCFEVENLRPKAYITSTYTQISTSICFQELAASFITQMNLLNHRDEIPDNINIFPLYSQGKPVVQNLALIRSKKRYLPRYTRLFMEILSQYFSEIKQFSPIRIAGERKKLSGWGE